MESAIAQAIQLKEQPVALLWSAEKPQCAMLFAEGKWGCVMWRVAAAPWARAALPIWWLRISQRLILVKY
jgi:hypothetical protein